MTFADLLISIGDGTLSAWDGIKGVLAAAWHAVDYVAQPILAPLLRVLNPISTAMGDAVYAALSPLPIWLGLTLISAVVGVLMLIAFRYLSNQDAIGRAKDDIKANLLAMKLYKDELPVVFRSQLRLLWAILRLQRYVLTPVLILLLPMLLGLAQMGVRYQWRPIRVGEDVLIVATVSGNEASPAEAVMEPPTGVAIEAGPVPGGGLVTWRVSGVEPGRHTLRFRAGGEAIEKEIMVRDGFARVSALRPSPRWTDQLLHPVEPPLPAGSPVQSITIDYPPLDSVIYGSNYWVLTFFILSMAVALILKPAFNVKF